MTLKTQITFKEYLKLLLGLTYRKPIMLLILFIDLAMMVWICGYYFSPLPLPKPTIYQFITLILISIVQPLVIYNTIWRNYKSSTHLGELLEIELTKNEIKIHGESFFLEVKWGKIFKIVEHRNWFLIYQNTLSAIVIPKNDFHGGELEDFIEILKGITNVPIHLKSN
ncbi:MAG: YcxB family protein, partial [Bacteroidota bacterium]